MSQDRYDFNNKEIRHEQMLAKYSINDGYPMYQQMPEEEKVTSLQQPPRGPGNQFQTVGREPRSAPPNFTPELPGEQRQFSNQQGFSGGSPEAFRGGNQRNRFRRCINRFTFIWLFNGRSFWFYPIFVQNQLVFGFRWNGRNWVNDTINMRRILHFQCF